jgi:hypothetical protein
VINFRYHVVSLAAALLALAVGVVLGAGFLDSTTSGDSDSEEAASSGDPAVASFESGYASLTGPDLLGDQLDGQSVVVLTTPGARAADINGVSSALDDAGADVVGQVALTAKLLDPGGRQFAEGVAQQVGEDVPGVSTDGDSYARIGAVVARSLVADETGDVDEDATTLRSAFVEGNLLSLTSSPTSLASMAVIVTGPRSSTSGDQGVSLAGIAAALDGTAQGVVVAGPSSASTSGGVLAALRDDDQTGTVSTVDVADSAAGRVVVALAAVKEAAGESGQWGTSRSADGAVPTS